MPHFFKPMIAMAGLCVLTAAALAEPAPILDTDKDADGKPLPFGKPAYRTPDTPLGNGPYKAIMVEDPTLPDHTLYYPADLDAAGKLPVVTWGNGACINAGNRFRIFLTEIASHGFFVISGGPIANVKYEVGPQENPAVRPPGSPALPTPAPAPVSASAPRPGDAVGRNTVAQLIAAIDWATAENERQGSKFYHRLDAGKVGVGGQSCGGTLAVGVSADPRVKTTAIFSGAPRVNSNLNIPGPPATGDAKAQLDAIHGPVLFIAGDAEHDIAYPASVDAAGYVSKVPVFFAWQDQLTHIGTYGMANGGQLARIGAQWFAWQLKGDQTAAQTFQGPACALCTEQGWHVTKKSID